MSFIYRFILLTILLPLNTYAGNLTPNELGFGQGEISYKGKTYRLYSADPTSVTARTRIAEFQRNVTPQTDLTFVKAATLREAGNPIVVYTLTSAYTGPLMRLHLIESAH